MKFDDETLSRWPGPIRDIAEHWESSHVVRADLEKCTGGLLKRRTAANLDALGQGVQGKFSVGRTVAYPLVCVCDYLARKFKESSRHQGA